MMRHVWLYCTGTLLIKIRKDLKYNGLILKIDKDMRAKC